MKKTHNKKKNAEHTKKKMKSIRQVQEKSNASRKKFSIGPYVTATLTAVLIGLFFGVVMLNLFTNKEDDASANGSQSSAVQDKENNENEGISKLATIQQMNAHVLQLGVFAEKENAENWSETYEQKGFSTTTFLRNDQYFLFVGVADTKEHAKRLAATLLDKDIEVYVKEWTMDELELPLTEEENKWIQMFQGLWQTTLQSLDGQEEIRLNDWKELIESSPQNSEQIKLFTDDIQPLFEQEIRQGNDFSVQNDLLNIWKSYEEIFIFK